MKILFLSLSFILLAGCTAQTGLHAVGERSSGGLPVGDYRIMSSANGIQAQGRFQDGKIDGKWRFFDSHQVMVAEFTYQHGLAYGPYRTYFSSAFSPDAAGKLESAGNLYDGHVVGKHIAYSSRGKAFSIAIFDKGKLSHAITGTNDMAITTANADTQFEKVLENTIRSLVR